MVQQSLQPPPAHGRSSERPKRRPAWRQSLVEVERGVAQGVRSDSSFFAHFFVGSVILAAAFVLGLPFSHWLILILALTLVLSAEMFRQSIRAALDSIGLRFPESAQRARRIGTAATFVALIGALLCVGTVFGHRLWQLFGP